jgi:hypothetical protein
MGDMGIFIYGTMNIWLIHELIWLKIGIASDIKISTKSVKLFMG